MLKVIRRLKIEDQIKQGILKFYPGIYEEKHYITVNNLLDSTRNLIDKIFEKHEKLSIELPDFKNLDINIFIVGGYIRDIFAGFKPKDIDLVTPTKPEELIKIFPHSDLTGKHFGVIRYKCYEIATFRKDMNHNYSGATDVEYGTFDDDWQRRDFTFNAMYYDIKTKTLLDPSGRGILDAINKEINFIGNPKDRIKEDTLRLLRILKFKKKGFQIPSKTLKAFRTNFDLLCKYGNAERIREHIEALVF